MSDWSTAADVPYFLLVVFSLFSDLQPILFYSLLMAQVTMLLKEPLTPSKGVVFINVFYDVIRNSHGTYYSHISHLYHQLVNLSTRNLYLCNIIISSVKTALSFSDEISITLFYKLKTK